jgi:hypothetical protein
MMTLVDIIICMLRNLVPGRNVVCSYAVCPVDELIETIIQLMCELMQLVRPRN